MLYSTSKPELLTRLLTGFLFFYFLVETETKHFDEASQFSKLLNY